MEETVLDDRSPGENVGNVEIHAPNRNNLTDAQLSKRVYNTMRTRIAAGERCARLTKEALT